MAEESWFMWLGSRLSTTTGASSLSGTMSPAPKARYTWVPGGTVACMRWQPAFQFLRRHTKYGSGAGGCLKMIDPAADGTFATSAVLGLLPLPVTVSAAMVP